MENLGNTMNNGQNGQDMYGFMDILPGAPSVPGWKAVDRQTLCRRRKQAKQNRLYLTLGAAAAVVLVAVLCFVLLLLPMQRYNKAFGYMEDREYAQAQALFAELGDYRDSRQLAEECQYAYGCQQMDEGNWDQAIAAFADLGDYEDSLQNLTKCRYQRALEWLAEGKWEQAVAAFTELDDYADSPDKLLESKLQLARSYVENGNFAQAERLFSQLSAENLTETDQLDLRYCQARVLAEQGNFSEAIAALELLGDYRDCLPLVDACRYQQALQLEKEGNIQEAYQAFATLDDYQDSKDRAKNLQDVYNRTLKKDKLIVTDSWIYEAVATAETTKVDADTLQVKITQPQENGTLLVWEFTGKWDPATGKLRYTDGKQALYPAEGQKPVETIYADGTGWLYIDGYLRWEDEKGSDLAKDCGFVTAPEPAEDPENS